MTQAFEDVVIPGVARPGVEIRVEPSPRWVRVRFGGEFVADSKHAQLLLAPGRLPVYYFPASDARIAVLVPSERRAADERGERSFWHVEVGDRRAEDAAWSFTSPAEDYEPLRDHVAFYWSVMDAWFEEDEEVFAHPRDPYHRVDVCQSSRHVRVGLGGQTAAETHRPRLLFETGLPTRYYIPKLDVRMDLLGPTATRSRCPYKGEAGYWSAQVGGRVYKDIVWSYPLPIPECPRIENHLCFFNERVDAIYLDGELQPVPDSPWSPRRR